MQAVDVKIARNVIGTQGSTSPGKLFKLQIRKIIYQ